MSYYNSTNNAEPYGQSIKFEPLCVCPLIQSHLSISHVHRSPFTNLSGYTFFSRPSKPSKIDWTVWKRTTWANRFLSCFMSIYLFIFFSWSHAPRGRTVYSDYLRHLWEDLEIYVKYIIRQWAMAIRNLLFWYFFPLRPFLCDLFGHRIENVCVCDCKTRKINMNKDRWRIDGWNTEQHKMENEFFWLRFWIWILHMHTYIYRRKSIVPNTFDTAYGFWNTAAVMVMRTYERNKGNSGEIGNFSGRNKNTK